MSAARLGRALVWAALALGLLLRIAAARGDLWLDEVWSLQLAKTAGSPLDVLWTLHHDNNNYLNTLWLMALSRDASPLVCRLLAIAAGAGTVLLAAAAARPRGGAAAVAAILVALSPFMVEYGSEARGYGPAMCFALAAFVALEHYLSTRERRFALAFALAGALGVLSHLTFAFVLAAAAVWTAVELARRRVRPGADLAMLVLPAALLAFLWLVDVRFQAVGGAPETELGTTLAKLVRAIFALPHGPAEPLALVFLGLVAWEVVALARARDSRAVFFAALFLAPIASLAVWLPSYALPRHFAVIVPFTLVLLAGALARLARLGRVGHVAAALPLALMALGSAVQLVPLLRDGRGHYRETIALLVANSASQPVTVGGFNGFRNRMMLDDQTRRLGVADRVVYVDRADLAAHPPEWLLLIDFAHQPSLMAAIDAGGRTYELVALAPFAGLSGWTWIIYHAAPAPALHDGGGGLWIRPRP